MVLEGVLCAFDALFLTITTTSLFFFQKQILIINSYTVESKELFNSVIILHKILM